MCAALELVLRVAHKYAAVDFHQAESETQMDGRLEWMDVSSAQGVKKCRCVLGRAAESRAVEMSHTAVVVDALVVIVADASAVKLRGLDADTAPLSDSYFLLNGHCDRGKREPPKEAPTYLWLLVV